MELLLSSKKFDGVILLGLGWRAVRGGFLRDLGGYSGSGMESAGRDWVEEKKSLHRPPGTGPKIWKADSSGLGRNPAYPRG